MHSAEASPEKLFFDLENVYYLDRKSADMRRYYSIVHQRECQTAGHWALSVSINRARRKAA